MMERQRSRVGKVEVCEKGIKGENLWILSKEVRSKLLEEGICVRGDNTRDNIIS
jgi:hypothetical protein